MTTRRRFIETCLHAVGAVCGFIAGGRGTAPEQKTECKTHRFASPAKRCQGCNRTLPEILELDWDRYWGRGDWKRRTHAAAR